MSAIFSFLCVLSAPSHYNFGFFSCSHLWNEKNVKVPWTRHPRPAQSMGGHANGVHSLLY